MHFPTLNLILTTSLILFPLLASAQQSMSIGLKAYVTGWQFERTQSFVAPSNGPEASFSNTFIAGTGIYFERKSPAGFSWSAEAAVLDVQHQVHVEGGIVYQSLSAPLFKFSLQAGYRFGLGKDLSLGVFTGATRYLYHRNIAGTFKDFELGNNTLRVNQFQRPLWRIPLRTDAQYNLSTRWMVSLGIEASADLNSFILPGYSLQVVDNQNQAVSSSHYDYRLLPVSGNVGIQYKF